MRNFLYRAVRLFARYCRSAFRLRRLIAFRISHRFDLVTHEGRLRLHAPLVCDGSGRVTLGSRISVGYGRAPMLGDGTVRLQARASDSVITVGDDTYFSNNVQVISEKSVVIGRRCLIGDAVLMLDSDFHNLTPEGRHAMPSSSAPIIIEDNVFIGSRAIVLKGVTIGKDTVIGAGSVVVRSIPPGVIAAGNPAKVIRSL